MGLIYRGGGKRLLDGVLAAVAIVVLAPGFLVVGAAVVIETGRPALFIQNRIGRNGATFRIKKFRSMTVGTPNVDSADLATDTITRVGRVIRRVSLDEIPQLFNVLKGDMSLVGPRPALPTQEDLLELREEGGSMRLRPGLTGLAQVNSYDGMSAEVKAEYDNQYARDIGFLSDAQIVAQTVRYLFSPPPVY